MYAQYFNVLLLINF